MVFGPNNGRATDLKGKIQDTLRPIRRDLYGPALANLLRKEQPDIATLTETYLLIDNTGMFDPADIERQRDLIRIVLDAMLADTQVKTQLQIAKDADRFNTSSLKTAQWALGVAIVAALAAIAALLH
jgi:hypothetical protein